MIDLKPIEQEILKFWDEKKIYEKLISRKGKKKFFLLDGPPYANGTPHIGHVKNTAFKDIVLRMEFMKGNEVLFQPGFDTHGLPIENMVEKKLELKDKKDIEKFGIGNFMKECRKNAALNVDLWMDTYKKLASMYVLKKPYLTYEDSYIESGWWAFSQIYKKGLVYEGEKPVMWCPHCETSLAGYEVTDSYKDVTDPGVYLLFKLKDEDASILVYTTTPWTLPANIAVAIAEDENYVKVDISGKKVILGEKRLEKLSEMGFVYNILETFKGKKLVGKKYEPLLDVPIQNEILKGKMGKSHIIIASIAILKERVASKVKTKKSLSEKADLFEEFVTMNDGTGAVHTAPGHGKTDFMVGQHYKLACVSPIDDTCAMLPESGFSGFVKKADKEIIKRLEDEGKLLYKETITHSYPLCWRCKSPLIFKLSKQLFLHIEKIKKLMLKENKKVNWMPEFARERFENWVSNAEDWNISRQRYWGIPIPLWKCECGKEKVIESKREMESLCKVKIDDLHSVEELSLTCECGKKMKKIKGIFDVWFDSGIAPFASMGYPENNKDLFETHFPVDRINEAQDQIRGWFYSLMFCSSAVFGKAPYKAVSMVGWVVDKNGAKMSKSQGNIVDAQETLNELGADMTRFYLCSDVAPYEIQKFNKEIAKKEIGNVFNVLWNLQNLISDKKISKLDIEDTWIISRLNNSMKKYMESIEKFETNNAMKEISNFMVNNLSRNYIQMTRDKDNGGILRECLIAIIKLLAPVSPFITEKIWQNLFAKGIVKEESIHLSLWPKVDSKKINLELENEFDLALKVIEIGLSERDKAKIGLKWPLAKATLYSQDEFSKEVTEIICRQLNVKSIEIVKSDDKKIILDTKMTPELESEGYSREFARNIQAIRKKEGLQKGQMINISVTCSQKSKQMLEENIHFLLERTNSNKLTFSDDKGENKTGEFSIKDENFTVLFL